MPPISIPIPPALPVPLPPFLTKGDCVLLLQHWRLGGKDYLTKLTSAGTLKFIQRPHTQRGDVVSSTAMIEFYKSMLTPTATS